MKNIINFDIDFSLIPNSVKKYLYIHTDLSRNIPINMKSNEEKMTVIYNDEIVCEPFWDETLALT
jgi:hypothetical protein